jgi:hypothetical protein
VTTSEVAIDPTVSDGFEPLLDAAGDAVKVQVGPTA